MYSRVCSIFTSSGNCSRNRTVIHSRGRGRRWISCSYTLFKKHGQCLCRFTETGSGNHSDFEECPRKSTYPKSESELSKPTFREYYHSTIKIDLSIFAKF